MISSKRDRPRLLIVVAFRPPGGLVGLGEEPPADTKEMNLARMASRLPKPAVAMDGTAGVKKRAKGLEPSTSSLGS